MKKFLLAILIPYLITGCATTYHQKNLFGGYSDHKYEKDVYQIGFDASLYTDEGLMEQYIQYRSAEIVLEQGYQYYTLINNYTDSAYRHWWKWMWTPWTPNKNTVTIKIFEERPDNIDARDAAEVFANLKDVVHTHSTGKELAVSRAKVSAVIVFVSLIIILLLDEKDGRIIYFLERLL